MDLKQNKVLGYYIGYASEQNLRYKASSGGIGTALQKYLLSLDDFGTSVTFVFNSNKCMYEPKMVYTSDDINVCGSIYQDVDIFEFVKDNINNIRSGIVVTCPPCQVSALKQLFKKNGIQAFIISFCCSGQTTIEGTWRYYEFLGIKKEDVANMQYRGNGWPSGIQIWLKNGNFIYRDNYTEPWSIIHKSGLYRPKRCYYCKLDTSYKADISIADPWLKNYKLNDKIGNTLFLINTEQGMDVISKMQELNLIDCIKSDYNSYYNAQKNNIEKVKRNSGQQAFLNNITRLVSCGLYVSLFSKTLWLMKLHVWIKRGLFVVSSKKNFKDYILRTNK